MKGNMMKISSRFVVIGAASALGVALVAGGAYAATGSLTVANAPGQVLQVRGVGPASAHASDTAMAHANPNAKGLFGDSTTHPTMHATTHPSSHATAMVRRSVSQVAPPAAQMLPAHHAEVGHAPEPAHRTAGTQMSGH